MDIRFIGIGFGNLVSAGRIIAIVSPDAAPIKRMLAETRERGMLIDATCGRRTRAVLMMDNNHILLSALEPKTIKNRLHSVADAEEI